MGTKFVRRTVDPAKLPSLTRRQKADLAALSARPDSEIDFSEIDFSDIPELTENFWKNAVRGKYYKATKPGRVTPKPRCQNCATSGISRHTADTFTPSEMTLNE
jgi:hypothetical protein